MIIFLLTVHCAIGQEQNNRWYFGYNNGVNFNTAPPTALNGGQTFTQEGTASIADRLTGNLLFYTDGARVWDRNNVIMPNGTGLLGGIDNISNVPNDLSSTSAAIIVPRPFNPNIYYIITIDQVNSTNGMRYTVVDMSLNGGFGDVVPGQKNILILNTRSEKMQAVPQANGCGYWLITTDSNGTQFLSYSITETGIDATPVVSPMAPGADFIERGHIKINSQLDKLALGNNVGFSNIPRIELYDFDNATGLISNPITWNYPFTLFNSFAGVEFSPDGTKLYISPGFIGIVQYDISSGNQATIEASFFDVTQSFGTPVTGTIQLGPNGIIYAATSSGLLSINNPNASGAACNPIANPISGLTGQTWYGLPQKVYVLDDPNISNDIVTNGNCTANAIPFSLQNTNDVQSVVWDFDDPSTGAQNTSTSLAPSHTFSAPGTYNVEVEVTYPCTIITFTTEVNIVSPTAPTFSIPNTLCTGAVAPALPVTSDNGINGTWSPATVDNTASGTYT
ncbi:MAG: PKD domain-containing protein, partial [Bacteroidota bacterium]